MTPGCCKLHSSDGPSKHALCSFHCRPLRPSPWKQTRCSWSAAEPELSFLFMVRWSNSPVELVPNDPMWLLPVKGQGEWSRFVFLPWRAGEPPDSPFAKLDDPGRSWDEAGLLERETFPRSLEWVFWDRLWRTEEKEWKAVPENCCGTTPRGYCCFLFPYISPLLTENGMIGKDTWVGLFLSFSFFLFFFF